MFFFLSWPATAWFTRIYQHVSQVNVSQLESLSVTNGGEGDANGVQISQGNSMLGLSIPTCRNTDAGHLGFFFSIP